MTGDWQNRGGTTQEFKKLPAMDLNAEHEFELCEVQIKDNVPDIYNPGKTVNKVTTVWKEFGKAVDYHKIYAEYNEYYTEKASLMKFLCKVTGRPFVPGTPVKLGEWLHIGMKVKARVLAKYNRDTGEPTGNYKFAEAIKPEGAPATSPQSITEALFLAKGSKDGNEALTKLTEAGAPVALIQLFIVESKKGNVKYPI